VKSAASAEPMSDRIGLSATSLVGLMVADD